MLPHDVQQFVGSGAFASSDPLFHSDTIHHVEFDFYGQRVVTVSSDKLVCIWDKEVQGNWRRSASWKVFFLFN
jgi:WD40 repeat protein